MDSHEIEKKVSHILETFGMSGKVAANAMGVAYQTFKSKKSVTVAGHSFNEKNLSDLVDYIKREAGKL